MMLPAHRIWAHPHTITGAVGVYASFISKEKLLREKLHILCDGIKTTPSSDAFFEGDQRIPLINRPFIRGKVRNFTPKERAILKKHINHQYQIFKEKIAHHRKISLKEVEAFAGGAIFTGQKAKSFGLVDEIITSIPLALAKYMQKNHPQNSYQIEYISLYNLGLYQSIDLFHAFFLQNIKACLQKQWDYFARQKAPIESYIDFPLY